MSELDLLALLPEKFRTSDLLLDLVDVLSEKLDSFGYTDTVVNRVGGRLQQFLSSIDTEMVLQDGFTFPTDRPVHLVIWNAESPGASDTKEYVTGVHISGNRFAIDRGKHQSSRSYHPANSRVVLYSPLSLKEMMEKTDKIGELINPRTVPGEYLQELASLLGATLQSAEYAEESIRRNELLSVIDWYRIKGTYDSVHVIQLITGLNFKFFDLYTNDYEAFVKVEWFVGNEGQNPPAGWGFTGEESGNALQELDSSYYKSPHFGLYIKLDLVYLEDEYNGVYYPKHIWRPALFGIPDVPESSIANYVEKTRPVNTVPHYGLYLECLTDQSGVPFITYDRNLQPLTATAITEFWEYGELYFDEQEQSPGNRFDDGHHFDTGVEAFISSITYWKIGTNGKFLIFDDAVASIDTVSGEGRVEGYRIFPDRFEFYVTLDKEFVAEGDEKGITELGLFRGEEGDMVLLATFPRLYKDDSLELLVKIIVYRTKDPNQYKEPLDLDPLWTIPLPDTITLDTHCVEVCDGAEIETEDELEE